MPKRKSVQVELLDLFKLKMNKDHQITLEKICERINAMHDDDWATLSPEAQSWFTKAAKAYKAEQDLPEFPTDDATSDEAGDASSVEEAEADDVRENSSDEENEDMPATRKKAVAKKAAANGSRPNARKVNANARKGVARGSGVPTVIKQLMIKNPEVTKDDLVEKLKDKGLKCTPLTVSGIRNDFRHSIRVLQSADLLRRQLIED